MMNERNTRPMPSTSTNWNRTAKRNAGKARRQAARLACVGVETEDNAPVVEAKVSGDFRIVVTTQYYENYGAHDWDGNGKCPQYWKAKGGSQFSIPLSLQQVVNLGAAGIAALAEEAMQHEGVTYRNEGAESYALGWELLPPGEVTEMESWGIPARVLV